MKNKFLSFLHVSVLLLGSISSIHAQGTAFTYQGKLTDECCPATGLYEMTFSLYNVPTGGRALLGASARLVCPVTNGLFTATLDFGSTVFDGNARWLELGVRTNGSSDAFAVLTPRQALTPTPYAILAGRVPNGAITAQMLGANSVTAAKIAPGAITGATLATNSVGSLQVADDLDLGSINVDGRLDVYRTPTGLPALTLDGASNAMIVFGDHGREVARLFGESYGGIILNQPDGNPGLQASAGSNAGSLALHYENAQTVLIQASERHGEGGRILMYNGAGTEKTVEIDAQRGTSGGGYIELRKGDGTSTMTLYGSEDGSDGAQIKMRNSLGTSTVDIDAESAVLGGGGYMALYKGDGTASVVLRADQGGCGRVTTQVLEITGGCDLSEQFHINGLSGEPEPGTLVSIDPANPGQLVKSTKPYDRTVAGVVSGAGGVQPGMLMGQNGWAGTGKHPVALTGRVYCQVDASYGAVQPGDLITTSATPGHGMKVADHIEAQGAIIGKAMSALQNGRGLVLVLVSLQ